MIDEPGVDQTSAPQPPYLHITCPSGFVHEATMKIVDEDGHETPIMACVRSVQINLDSEDPWATATVVFEGVRVDVNATPADLDKTRRIVDSEYKQTVAELDSLKPCPDSPASPDA